MYDISEGFISTKSIVRKNLKSTPVISQFLASQAAAEKAKLITMFKYHQQEVPQQATRIDLEGKGALPTNSSERLRYDVDSSGYITGIDYTEESSGAQLKAYFNLTYNDEMLLTSNCQISREDTVSCESYSYDDAGRMIAISVENQYMATFTYNDDGQLVSATIDGDDWTFQY